MPFKFESVSELRKELGQYDAVVQLTEISVRNFLSQAEKSGNLRHYVTEQSLKYNIRTNDVDIDILKQRLPLQYIASVQQYAEYFFYKFRSEYQDLFDFEIDLGSSNSYLLDKILDQLPYDKSELLEKVGQIHYDLIIYYKDIRNRYSHYYKISDKSLNENLKEIMDNGSDINEVYEIDDAPNNYDTLNFNDFMLFTRALKYFAQNLCDFIAPNEKVYIDYLRRINFKRHLINKEERYKNAIKYHITHKFGEQKIDFNYIYNALVA